MNACLLQCKYIYKSTSTTYSLLARHTLCSVDTYCARCCTIAVVQHQSHCMRGRVSRCIVSTPAWRSNLMTRKTTSIKSVAHTATSAIAHTTTRPPIDKQLFLLKSEPDDFSIDDLAQAGNSAGWEGVRNAQAANICAPCTSATGPSSTTGAPCVLPLAPTQPMRHSSCKDKGIVGIAEVVREAYPDATAWDPSSKYFDPKTNPEQPKVPSQGESLHTHTRPVGHGRHQARAPPAPLHRAG